MATRPPRAPATRRPRLDATNRNWKGAPLRGQEPQIDSCNRGAKRKSVQDVATARRDRDPPSSQEAKEEPSDRADPFAELRGIGLRGLSIAGTEERNHQKQERNVQGFDEHCGEDNAADDYRHGSIRIGRVSLCARSFMARLDPEHRRSFRQGPVTKTDAATVSAQGKGRDSRK